MSHLNTVLHKLATNQKQQARKTTRLENPGSIRKLGFQGPDIASATTIELGHGNYFEITGTTSIHYIITSGWTRGSLVILRFHDVVQLRHLEGSPGADAAEMHLNKAADNFTADGDVVGFVFDGTNWHEVFRRETS